MACRNVDRNAYYLLSMKIRVFWFSYKQSMHRCKGCRVSVADSRGGCTYRLGAAVNSCFLHGIYPARCTQIKVPQY